MNPSIFLLSRKLKLKTLFTPLLVVVHSRQFRSKKVRECDVWRSALFWLAVGTDWIKQFSLHYSILLTTQLLSCHSFKDAFLRWAFGYVGWTTEVNMRGNNIHDVDVILRLNVFKMFNLLQARTFDLLFTIHHTICNLYIHNLQEQYFY